MKVTMTEPAPWKRVLDIEVPSTQVQEQIDSAFQRYRKQIKLPGFRQGKAPLDLLKARFGEEIKREVLQKLVPEFYEKAREEVHLVPLGQAVVEEIEFQEGQSLRFKATVEVKPAIDLKEYRGIRVTKRPVEVTDEQLQRALNALRDRHADVVRVEGKAQPQQYLVADIQQLDRTGLPIIGRKLTNRFFQLGDGMFGPEFDDHLVGIQAGEERRVSTVYPQDYQDPNLAGQDALFQVTVRDVLEKRLPALDDAFAEDLGSSSLEALTASIRRDLEQEPDREVRGQLIEHLVENNSFEVPQSMLRTYLDQLVANAKRSTREPVDEEELRHQYHQTAINQIKRYLIFEEIAEREGITVTEAELDERIALIAQRGNLTVEQVKRAFRENGRIERIESEIKEDKVLDFLVHVAEIHVG
ncbi:MAG: trigger factor [Candidatus Latescibacteria bacterium]|nr:trigger factor [Candidatus Latescibacterota bacterium]